MLVDKTNCIPPPDGALFQECNLAACETFQFINSSWTSCSKSCGGGYRTRTLTCFSSYGYAVDKSECSCEDVDCSTVQECNTEACEEPYLTFTSYSPCSLECGGGVKIRDAACNNADGTAAPPELCSDLGLRDNLQEVPCNTARCNTDAFIWRTGDWTPCSPAVCGGTRTREVTCWCDLISRLHMHIPVTAQLLLHQTAHCSAKAQGNHVFLKLCYALQECIQRSRGINRHSL